MLTVEVADKLYRENGLVVVAEDGKFIRFEKEKEDL